MTARQIENRDSLPAGVLALLVHAIFSRYCILVLVGNRTKPS